MPPSDHAIQPHIVRARNFSPGICLAVGRVEELAVEHRRPHGARLRQSGSLGDHVQRLAVPGGVEQRGKRVRLAAAERRHQLQHAVARPAFQPRQHVLQQPAQSLGQVGARKKCSASR